MVISLSSPLALDTVLIFSERVEVRILSLDTPEINDISVPLHNLTGVFAVAGDPATDSVFWTDIFKDTINRARIDVSARPVLKLVLACPVHILVCDGR